MSSNKWVKKLYKRTGKDQAVYVNELWWQSHSTHVPTVVRTTRKFLLNTSSTSSQMMNDTPCTHTFQFKPKNGSPVYFPKRSSFSEADRPDSKVLAVEFKVPGYVNNLPIGINRSNTNSLTQKHNNRSGYQKNSKGKYKNGNRYNNNNNNKSSKVSVPAMKKSMCQYPCTNTIYSVSTKTCKINKRQYN